MDNGFNYIREIMQMNLPDTPVEKAIKDTMGGFSRYQFIGYMADSDYLLSNDPKVVVRINKCDHGTFQVRAHAGDVIMHRNKLYAWCVHVSNVPHEKDKVLRVGMWLEFNPGPCTPYNGPKPNKEENMAKHNLFNETLPCLEYVGVTSTEVFNYSTAARLRIDGKWVSTRPGLMVMYDGRLYVCSPDGKWRDLTSANVNTTPTTEYNRIPYGFMAIKNVVFNDPATIVMWQDGSKTVVKCGEDEEFDWEKGLAMAVAKKAFGNQGNYFNQFKKWKPEEDEAGESVGDITLTLSERLNRVFGDPRITDAKKKLAAVQELICDMALRGATKTELMRAIRFSKDLIDVIKGRDLNIAKSVEALGIIELEAKYQPKK